MARSQNAPEMMGLAYAHRGWHRACRPGRRMLGQTTASANGSHPSRPVQNRGYHTCVYEGYHCCRVRSSISLRWSSARPGGVSFESDFDCGAGAPCDIRAVRREMTLIRRNSPVGAVGAVGDVGAVGWLPDLVAKRNRAQSRNLLGGFIRCDITRPTPARGRGTCDCQWPGSSHEADFK